MPPIKPASLCFLSMNLNKPHSSQREGKSLNSPAPPTQKLRSNYAKDPESKRVRVTTRHIHALFPFLVHFLIKTALWEGIARLRRKLRLEDWASNDKEVSTSRPGLSCAKPSGEGPQRISSWKAPRKIPLVFRLSHP
jgi:hypothetical protein